MKARLSVVIIMKISLGKVSMFGHFNVKTSIFIRIRLQKQPTLIAHAATGVCEGESYIRIGFPSTSKQSKNVLKIKISASHICT